MNTSVVSAAIIEGNLIIGLSDGSVINCGFVQGPQGLSGPQGPMGATGDNGTDGNTILTFAGTPGNEMGTDGDYAIDNVNWRIYGPKSGGVWGKAKSMLPDAENMIANGRMPSGSTGGGGGSGEGGGGGIIYTNTVQLTNSTRTLLSSTGQYKIIPNPPSGTTNQEGANLWGFGSAFDNFDAAIPVATGVIPPTPLPGFTDNWDGRLWFDSSEEELTLYIYNDGVWVPAAPPVSLDSINATIEAGLLVQAEIIERILSGEAVQDTIEAGQITQNSKITANELAISNLEASSGVLIKSEWDIILSGSSRPGKVMLYTSGLQGGVVAWTDVAFIGFINPDKNGATYDFSDIPVGANIRLTRSDNTAAGCTFKIGANSDASIGLFSVESVVVAAGAPAHETTYGIDFLPGAAVTIEVMKTITAASSDFADFQTRIAAL